MFLPERNRYMRKKKIALTVEELRFVWSLGFSTGRLYGDKGAGYDDETPLWNKDVERLSYANKPLAEKIEKARDN